MMVRASDYGVIGRGVDSSWLTHRDISYSRQCSTTGATKAVVYTILFWGMTRIKIG